MFKLFVIFFFISTCVLSAQELFRNDMTPTKIAGDEGAYYMNPKWSPDSNLIAFTESNYNSLLVADLRDKGIRKISDDEGVGFGFTWSSDGVTILTRSTKRNDQKSVNAVKLFNAYSGNEKILVDYNQRITSVPAWYANETEVIYNTPDRIETVKTGKLAKLNGTPISCYSASGRIIVENSSTGEKRTLHPEDANDYINVVLSPNGQYISFEVMGGNLFTMKTDGTELTDLGRGYRAKWSPDSEYLVYMITQDDGHDYTASDLYIIKRDGSEKLQVTDTSNNLEMNPCWSPNGKEIAYNEYRTGTIWIKKIAY